VVRPPSRVEGGRAVDGVRREGVAQGRDPIPTFATYLTGLHVLTDEKAAEIDAKITATIDDAVEFAMNASDPKPEDAVTDLYA